MHHVTQRSSSAFGQAAKKAQPSLVWGIHKEIKFSNKGRASILKAMSWPIPSALLWVLKVSILIFGLSFYHPHSDGVTVAKAIS
jgi:hypothetical protein